MFLVDVVRLMYVYGVIVIFIKYEKLIVGIWIEVDCLKVDIINFIYKNFVIYEVMLVLVILVLS